MDSAADRMILRAMACDTAFLSRAHKLWFKDMFSTAAERTLAQWCVRHFETYKEAPASKLEALFASAVRHGEVAQQQAEVLGTLIQSLSTDTTAVASGSDVLLDLTTKHVRRRKLTIMAEDIQAYLSKGELDKADSVITAFRAECATTKAPSYYDVMGSADNTRNAFEHSSEPLFRYPGHMDNIVSPMLTADAFVAILAPEKRGKTFWLVDMMLRALSYDKSVAFFSAGDMTAPQLDARVTVAVAGKSNRPRYAGRQLFPVWDCMRNRTGTCPRKPKAVTTVGGLDATPYDRAHYEAHCKLEYSPCSNCKDDTDHPDYWKPCTWFIERDFGSPLEWYAGLRAKERFMGPCTITKRCRVSAHSTYSLKVSGINQTLKSWFDTDGFKPDVIIIDYADILAPEKERGHQRDEINDTWGRLRGLSQEWHGLVVTATQGNREAAMIDDMTINHFSDDKRKKGHVTSMLALNQSLTEKEMMVYRVSALLDRDNSTSMGDQALCLAPIYIGRPCIDNVQVRRNVSYRPTKEMT
jgi:hypothetical protein